MSKSSNLYLGLLLFCFIVTGKAETGLERIGFSRSYPTNFGDWPDAFLAGNGKMGIMVFGDPLHERVIFNDRHFNIAANTNSPTRSFAQMSDADLQAIKSNCVAGNFAEANNLAVSAPKAKAGGEGNRHPGYEMLISIPEDGAVKNYSRICDFKTGEIIVKWTDNRGDWERRAFVSRKDNVIVQYLLPPNTGKLTCSLELTTDPGMRFPSGWNFQNVPSADYLNLRVNYPRNTGGAGYEGVTRIVTHGGTKTLSGNTLTISNADSVVLLTRIEKYYANASKQWSRQSLQQELAAIPIDYQTLLQGQIATHGAIYDRVKIDFGASAEDRAKSNEELLAMQKNSTTPVKALWERVFDAGRYYYLSSSSDQSPPDLLGIWGGDCNAGWGGWYHLDANLNLQVAQGNIGDLPEAMEGYFKINEGWRADFETNAKKLLGCRGMVACGNTPGTNGLKGPIGSFYPYQYATGEEPWLLYPFWEHYQITGDTNFLRNRLYPLLKGMGEFYEDFLTLTDTNGHYIFAGSVSPENQPANIKVSLLNNSSFDISGARFALAALIETCETLGVDQKPGEGLKKWKNIYKKLPPYLINADGALQEWNWPGLKDNYIHRHMSHILSVWPYREITLEKTPDLFNAAAVVLAKKDSYHEVAGHGILHGALVAADLNNAQSVNKRLLQLTKEDYYYASLFSSHNNKHETFCADTCNTVPAIMMEMLISSSPGILELLPALPPALTQGSISGVKGRNRVTIQNLSWDIENKTVNCILKSDIDQDLVLIERSGIESIESDAAIRESPLGIIARNIRLKAGASTHLSLKIR